MSKSSATISDPAKVEGSPTSPPIPAALEKMLLDIGGTRVVYMEEDPYKDRLLQSGRLFTNQVKKVRGRRSRCHSNSAKIWAEDPERFKVVTGYGLSEDGKWRQHSWVLDEQELLETTVKRTHYFGVVLTDHEAALFWMEVYLSREYENAWDLLLDASKKPEAAPKNSPQSAVEGEAAD